MDPLTHPKPVVFHLPLPCPACAEPLDEDHDGTSCDQCGGLLVPRVWAERCLPAMGRPTLPPVFAPVERTMPCPSCRRAMVPVLCHTVASWSCAHCRWLFIEGPKRKQLVEPNAEVTIPARAIEKPKLLAVVGERASKVQLRLLQALGLVVIAGMTVAGAFIEGKLGF